MKTILGYLRWFIIIGLVISGACSKQRTKTLPDEMIPTSYEFSRNSESGFIELVKLSWPPVSTFERFCAKCHGQGGSKFGQNLSKFNDEQLPIVVGDMMVSSGITTPSQSDIQAMLAFCRAIINDEPFICVTIYSPWTETDEGVLMGEATPNAEVMLLTCGRCWTISDEEDGFWELNSPPDRPELLVQKDSKSTELSLRYAQWSHSIIEK